MKQLKITSSITSRESRALEKYLQEIGKMEMLTPEEEVALARRIKQGDEKAMEELTKGNLRFVVSVALINPTLPSLIRSLRLMP